MNKYDIKRTCGEGSFAVVYEAVRRSDGVRVAPLPLAPVHSDALLHGALDEEAAAPNARLGHVTLHRAVGALSSLLRGQFLVILNLELPQMVQGDND